MRKKLKPQQGEERETYVQAMRIGDVALVGVPAEYFTVLGVDIKNARHSSTPMWPNWRTIGSAICRIGKGMHLGGYQTWMGLHSYAEEGTGERIADLAVELLSELKAGDRPPTANNGASLPHSGDSPVPVKTAPAGRQTPQAEQQTFHFADPVTYRGFGCGRAQCRQPGGAGLGRRRPHVRGRNGRIPGDRAQRPHPAAA